MIYEGNWKNGLKDGFGTMTLPNNDSFTGLWKNGEIGGPVDYKFNDTSPWNIPDY